MVTILKTMVKFHKGLERKKKKRYSDASSCKLIYYILSFHIKLKTIY